MDRETAVIRSEIAQTQIDLDQKITRLENRARELHPRRLMPECLLDRVIGAVLAMVGVRMAWRQYRARVDRRDRIREAFAGYGRS